LLRWVRERIETAVGFIFDTKVLALTEAIYIAKLIEEPVVLRFTYLVKGLPDERPYVLNSCWVF
jgi:hypothetical protein